MTPVERMLAGDLSVAALVDAWGRRPVHLTGRPDRLQHLLSTDRLQAFLGAPTFPDRSFLMAYFDRGWQTGPVTPRDGAAALTVPNWSIPRRDAADAYAAGATVGVFRLEEAFSELRALCEDLHRTLGLFEAPSAAALWSPDGGGFGPHFDAIGTTVLQLEGAKRWRWSTRAAVVAPVSNAMLRDGRPHYFEKPDADVEPWERPFDEGTLEGWVEATLTPGDVLILPAGFWHVAAAVDRSLAVTVQTQTTRLPRLFHAGWRAERGGGASDTVPPLLAGRAGPTDAGVAWLRERLGEALASLGRWRDDPERLAAERLRG